VFECCDLGIHSAAARDPANNEECEQMAASKRKQKKKKTKKKKQKKNRKITNKSTKNAQLYHSQ
jgi:hypothetical protein